MLFNFLFDEKTIMLFRSMYIKDDYGFNLKIDL
jgi:hypothetical protein